jgi:hypothetical protein
MAGVAGRAAGLLVLLYVTFRVLEQGLTLGAGGLLALLHIVNLVFHEAGHVIWGFLGRFMGVLGGSLNQVLVPAICVGAFLRTRYSASAAVAVFWTGQSLCDVAVYAADGRAMALPLLADGLIHDWNWILGTLGLLQRAEGIGRLLFGAGALLMLGALAFLTRDLLRAWRAAGPLRIDSGRARRVE